MAKPTQIQEMIQRAIPLDDYVNCEPKRKLAIARRLKLEREIQELLKHDNEKPGPSVTK